ncbi:MAG: hypothetical protein K2X47_16470 [Bdellovibrionales bacterium]|nr:hypothetical protein [Bdellovibrionales bacterium]
MTPDVIVFQILNQELGEQALRRRMEGLAEACYRFTPKVSFGEGARLFLEIGQTKHLFKREGLIARLQVLVRRFGLQVQWGEGITAEMALGALRFPGVAFEKWPLEVLADVLNPFLKEEESRRRLLPLILILKKLRVRNFGELKQVGKQDLVSRFGDFGGLIYDKIHGRRVELWPIWNPPLEITEEQMVEGVSLQHGSLEALLFPMRASLDRIRSRLWAREQKLSRLELTFFLDHAQGRPGRRQWLFEFHFVQSSALNVLAVIRERLGRDLQKNPLEDPVIHFVFKVVESQRASHSQRDMLSQFEENAESWNHLIARLTEKLGEEHVFQTKPKETYQPEKTWEKTLGSWGSLQQTHFSVREQNWEAYQKALDVSFRDVLNELQRGQRESEVSSVIPRPTRLLKQPLLLRFRNSSLSLDDPRFDKKWTVESWDGPERLRTLWWESSELERDYFMVSAAEGERLWIFQQDNQFYLHGFFD